jgi:hypothetical protein
MGRLRLLTEMGPYLLFRFLGLLDRIMSRRFGGDMRYPFALHALFGDSTFADTKPLITFAVRCNVVPPLSFHNALHALLSMLPIQDLVLLHIVMKKHQIRRRLEAARIQIPDLDNAELRLRTDRDAHDRVRWIFRTGARGRRHQVALEDLWSHGAMDFEAVRPSMDIVLVFPQGARVTLHHTQQHVGDPVRAHFPQEGAQLLPVPHLLQHNIGLLRP